MPGIDHGTRRDNRASVFGAPEMGLRHRAERAFGKGASLCERRGPGCRVRPAGSFLFSGARLTVSGSKRLRSVRRAVEYGAIPPCNLALQDLFISLRLLPIICHL